MRTLATATALALAMVTCGAASTEPPSTTLSKFASLFQRGYSRSTNCCSVN